MTPSQHPQLAGELEYGSILPNGDDWRLRKFDVGMGETEYRIFRNEKFFAQFDDRKDADLVMGLITIPARNDSDVVGKLYNKLSDSKINLKHPDRYFDRFSMTIMHPIYADGVFDGQLSIINTTLMWIQQLRQQQGEQEMRR
jgi:hypothetical protein